MGLLSRVTKFFRGPVKESADLGFGFTPDPGLSNANFFRQWVGIYQLVDRMARARGGNLVERPVDERMLYIARGLMRYNPYAQGMVSALRNHTLGSKGFQHTPTGPSRRVLGTWLDRWKQEQDWWSWEREIYERVHIEGESVTRFFPQEDTVELRPIEPEWIIAPDGTIQWTFGFYNEPDDVQDITALNELRDSGNDIIDASEWVHVKSKLSMRADKRGRSDFLAIAQLLDDSFKTWRNFLQSEAVRQSIVYFAKQAAGVTSQDLDAAIARETDYAPPATPTGRHVPDPLSMQFGSAVEYVQDGTELFAAPAANAQGTMTGVNAGLLAAGRAYHIPLVLMSGDMSANNTLDFGDESPFGITIQDEQNWYSRYVKKILWRAVEFAVDEGQLPESVLMDGTDIEVATERKPSHNSLENTQRCKTLYEDGVISARERATMEGFDYDEQQKQRRKEGAQQPAIQQDDEFDDGLGDAAESAHGPPPRAGLIWNESTKRWRSLETGKEHADGKHSVMLPKNRKKLTITQAHHALEQLGYKITGDRFDLATKTSILSVIKPDGTKATITSDEVKEIVYRNAAEGDPSKKKRRDAAEDITVTVHRGGKTFLQHRKGGKAKVKPVVDIVGNTVKFGKATAAKVHAVASEISLRVNTAVMRATPAAQKVLSLLGAVLDEPSDLQKFAYNPATSSGTASGNPGDFVKQDMQDHFGIGLSGHLVASIASKVLAAVFMKLKRKFAASEAVDLEDGVVEVADLIRKVYANAMRKLAIKGKLPSTELIADNIRKAIHGS